MLFLAGGTGRMTGLLTTAGQSGCIGDRCQTEYTLSGLGHHAKGWNRGVICLPFTTFFLADLGVKRKWNGKRGGKEVFL